MIKPNCIGGVTEKLFDLGLENPEIRIICEGKTRSTYFFLTERAEYKESYGEVRSRVGDRLRQPDLLKLEFYVLPLTIEEANKHCDIGRVIYNFRAIILKKNFSLILRTKKTIIIRHYVFYHMYHIILHNSHDLSY